MGGATPGTPPIAAALNRGGHPGLGHVRIQRAFLVARFRGGVSRSAIVAIAVGTSR
ncbi:hypothetical protein B0E53_03450 [Micromonospora sp. MH33]|nr:hypothetical protein B0E53_03450 [Micromonospora sp. MH33]